MPISLDQLTNPKTDLMHSGWWTYVGVLGISIWGGVTRYLSEKDAFSWRSLIAQLFSSSFAGMLAFFACQYANINGPLTGVIIGVCSHMGTPALIALAMKMKFVRDLLEGTKK